MRRTWVKDSRERRRQRSVSLNALCLEQLEDRLTLSHTPAPWAIDLAFAPSISPNDTRSPSDTRSAIFPQAMFTAETRLAVERLAGANDLSGANGDVRMEFKPVPTETVAPIVSPLPVTKLPWSGVEIIESPVAKLPSIDRGGTEMDRGSTGALDVRLTPTWTNAFATGTFATGTLSSFSHNFVTIGSVLSLDALAGLGHAGSFVINREYSPMHIERFEVLSASAVNVASHLGEGDPHPGPGPAARDMAFDAVFSARDRWLSDTRSDGSTRLEPMTNFAGGQSTSMAAVASAPVVASAWAAAGPAPIRTASLGADGGFGDILLDGDKQDAHDASPAARQERGTAASVARASLSALRLWHEMPVFASLAAESLASEVASRAGFDTGLLDTLSLNTAALDQALDNVVGEVERLGVEIATWFDRLRIPSWAATTVVVAAIGGGGLLARRWRTQHVIDAVAAEESSTWLFTRLQSTLG